MPVALDRPGRPFFMPERKAVMWRAVDPSDPGTVVGVGVEVAALAALEGRRGLDGEHAAEAFANHLTEIEESASQRFDSGGTDQRVIVLSAGDLSDAIERARLQRVMKRVAPRNAD
jgi:hypothetical protein